jgi:signal transduction histidine kinase
MADSAVQEIVYSISHDFGRPIRQIMAFADLLSDKHSAGLDDESKEWFEYLHRAGEEAQTMLERLLIYSRMHETQTTPSSIDLAMLAQDIATELAARQPDNKRDVDIQNSVEGEICVDPTLLHTALLELLENALIYSDEGAVTLSFSTNDSELLATVSDTGAGIAPDKFTTALRLFGRLRPVEARHVGVGLNIAQRAAQSLGGRLSLEQHADSFSATVSAAL